MKFQFLLRRASLGLLLTVASGISAAEAGERLSREELIARRDSARERSAELKPKIEAEKKAHPASTSILDRSIVISNGRNWTFVPKGALLNVPEKLQERVNATPERGSYLPFAEFSRKNRGWLTTYSVTLEQARGNDPIKEEVRTALQESGRVVVSVCQGGAISTRAPKVENATAKN